MLALSGVRELDHSPWIRRHRPNPQEAKD